MFRAFHKLVSFKNKTKIIKFLCVSVVALIGLVVPVPIHFASKF